MQLSVDDILSIHQDALARWETGSGPEARGDGPAAGLGRGGGATTSPAAGRNRDVDASLADLVEAGHFANFMIWGLEDEARLRDAGDARIAAVKRAIDPWNQKRNDLMEAIDQAILAGFANIDVHKAELHSESAGMMIDRLSILALKVCNVERVEADALCGGDEATAADCRARRDVLVAQRDDLAGCLARLLEDFAAGRRCFRVYRQLKAYNDERFNPKLRAAAQGRGGRHANAPKPPPAATSGRENP